MARPRKVVSRHRFGPRPGHTLRIAIYLRVSTPAQVAGFGLKVQDEMCRDVIKMKFRDQPHTIVDVYCDGGVSGKKASRPHFDRLNKDIHDGKVDVVVAAKVDRIGRTMEDIHKWVFDIDSRSIRLITADGRLDNADEGFKLMLSLLAWMADTEHLLILERTTGGREAKLIDGGWVGGTKPYGLMTEGKGDTAKLVVNPKEREVLSLAVGMIVDEGLSLDETCDALNNLGHRTRTGRQWVQGNLRQILLGNALQGFIAWREGEASNAVRDDITGEFVYGSSARITVPEILPEERVKAVRATLTRRTLQPRRADTIYTLSKRLIGICGKHYIGAIKYQSDRRVYRCTGGLSNHANYIKCGCRDIEAAEIEKAVWEVVAEGFRDRGHLQDLADRWLGAVPLLADNYRARIAELEEELDAKRKGRKKKILKLLALVEDDDDFDAETIAELKAEMKEKEAALEEELARVRGWLEDAEVQEQRVADVLALADKVRDNLDDVTPGAILDALSLFDVRVHVRSKVERRATRKSGFEGWFEETGFGVPVTMTDEAWAAVADIFPPSQSVRPQRSRREVLDAVFYKVRSGLSWPEMKQHVHAADSLKLLAIELHKEGLLPEAVRRLQAFETTELGSRQPLPDLHIDATFIDPLAEQRILTMPGLTEGFSRVPFAEVLNREYSKAAA